MAYRKSQRRREELRTAVEWIRQNLEGRDERGIH